MLGTAGKVVRAALVAAAAAGLVLAGPGAARADAGERVARYAVNVEVHADGTAHVREAITYDFGANIRHGIHREIRYRPDTGPNRNRRMDVSGIKASSPDAPARTAVSDDGRYRTIRIGDPDRTVTGVHAYVIEYDTDHVATKTGGHVRYAWNAVGDEWDVPISDVTVRLSGPAAMSGARCFAGASGSTAPCDSAGASGTHARFAQRELAGAEGLTVQADLPAGSVATAPEPQPEDPGQDSAGGLFGWIDAHEAWFLPGAGTAAASGGLLLLAALAYGFTLYLRFARTRRPDVPGLPYDLTPGLAAYLHDVNDASAMAMSTVLDLARRGYLRIDEIPGWRNDWMLTCTAVDPPPAEHERLIFDGLFGDRDQVRVRQLRNRFYRTVRRVTRALDAEVVRRGWSRVPHLRGVVRAATAPFGVFGLTLFVFRYVDGWPFLAVASWLVSLVIAQCLAPQFRFNAAGVRAQRQVRELRRQLAEPGAVQRFGPEAMLPYAAAFGRLRQWEDRITYDGRVRFAFYTSAGAGLALFTNSAGSSMVSTPGGSGGGSGGGFSGGDVGGGGGGGGGGSW